MEQFNSELYEIGGTCLEISALNSYIEEDLTYMGRMSENGAEKNRINRMLMLEGLLNQRITVINSIIDKILDEIEKRKAAGYVSNEKSVCSSSNLRNNN